MLYTLAISNSMISAQRAAGICTAVSMADFQGSEAMSYSLRSTFSVVVQFLFFNRKSDMMNVKNSGKVRLQVRTFLVFSPLVSLFCEAWT